MFSWFPLLSSCTNKLYSFQLPNLFTIAFKPKPRIPCTENGLSAVCHLQFAKDIADVIAHRLATIRKADKIVVIDKGIVIESGTHEQLIASESGLYRSLSKLQFESASLL